jgi:hypothetical protein
MFRICLLAVANLSILSAIEHHQWYQLKGLKRKVRIYKEYRSVCTLVVIGTLASECAPSLRTGGGGGGTLACG